MSGLRAEAKTEMSVPPCPFDLDIENWTVVGQAANNRLNAFTGGNEKTQHSPASKAIFSKLGGSELSV